MKIHLQHLNLRSRDRLDRWVEEQILSLAEVRQIDEANVRLECRTEVSPRFAVRVHLVTPGPDLHAETRDHTLRAAFVKAMERLRAAVAVRPSRRSTTTPRPTSNFGARKPAWVPRLT